VWTVPGVINDNGATIFACTNGNTPNVTIGIEIYGASGTYVTGNTITAGPGSTVMFATDAVPSISWDINLNVGILAKGHGRIVASTTKGVLCSAFRANIVSGVPTVELTIAKAFKQKGD
jgi:hypothetical protein